MITRPHLQIEVEDEEETMAEETFKIEEGGMMVHHRDEGVMTILNHEEEGDQVGILRTEEDQTALLLEEDDMTMTIVGTEIMVITEVIGLAENDPEITTGEVTEVEIEVEALEEMIAVTIAVMTVVMIAAVMEGLVVAADAGGDVRIIFDITCHEQNTYF